MRKNKNDDFISMKSVLEQFKDRGGLHKGMDKVDAKQAWVEVMGAGVNNYTTSVKLHNKTLLVGLSSSVLREELNYGLSQIIENINSYAGRELIDKVVLR